MAESNPLRGFPRLRRAAVSSAEVVVAVAGRWKAVSGAVMLQQKRGRSRSLTQFSSATQRLCLQQRKSRLFFLEDALEPGAPGAGR